jgi:hypothetical protein
MNRQSLLTDLATGRRSCKSNGIPQCWLNLLTLCRFAQIQLRRRAIDAEAADNRSETHDRDSTTREALQETRAKIPLLQELKSPYSAFPFVLYDAIAVTTPPASYLKFM